MKSPEVRKSGSNNPINLSIFKFFNFPIIQFSNPPITSVRLANQLLLSFAALDGVCSSFNAFRIE